MDEVKAANSPTKYLQVGGSRSGTAPPLMHAAGKRRVRFRTHCCVGEMSVLLVISLKLFNQLSE
jgi:hypothetical protein